MLSPASMAWQRYKNWGPGKHLGAVLRCPALQPPLQVATPSVITTILWSTVETTWYFAKKNSCVTGLRHIHKEMVRTLNFEQCHDLENSNNRPYFKVGQYSLKEKEQWYQQADSQGVSERSDGRPPALKCHFSADCSSSIILNTVRLWNKINKIE